MTTQERANAASRDCSGCGVPMRLSTARRERYDAGAEVFHSRDCQKAHKNVTLICAHPTCLNTFERPKVYVERSTTGKLYCSKQCRDEIGTKPKTGTHTPCEQCGTAVWVKPSEPRKRFCSMPCQNEWQRRNQVELNCAWCEVPFIASPSKAEGKRYCSYACAGRARSAASEGWLTSDGYKRIPHPDKPGQNILEHVYRFEQLIGRELAKGEEVHHCNRVRDDNRTDGPPVVVDGKLRSGNLELWTTSQPAGGRVPDVLLWMYEQMGLYASVTDLPQQIARMVLAEHGTPEERAQYARVVLQGMVE